MSLLSEVFTKRLNELRLDAQNELASLQGTQQRRWHVPREFTGSTLDVPNLHMPAFDRQALNAEYVSRVSQTESRLPATVAAAVKMQIDYNAAEERAFRARHQTLCRAFCNAAGRKFGLGYGATWRSGSGVERTILEYLTAGPDS